MSASLSPVILQNCTQTSATRTKRLFNVQHQISVTLASAGLLSHVQLFAPPMNCSPPGSLSREFSKQEYWSRLPSPTPGDLPNPKIKPTSPASPALAGWFFTTGCHPGSPCVGISISYPIMADTAFLVSRNKLRGSLTCIPGRGHSGSSCYIDCVCYLTGEGESQ